LKASRSHLREVQDVVYQRYKPVNVALGYTEKLALVLTYLAGLAIKYKVNVAPNGGQRRYEFR